MQTPPGCGSAASTTVFALLENGTDMSDNLGVAARGARLWRTVRPLKAGQIANRLTRKFVRPVNTDGQTPALRVPDACWIPCPGRAPSMMACETFRLLSVERSIATAADWNRKDWPKLWLYNLHYFDDLLAVGAEERTVWHARMIGRWIGENPPLRGNGWEPYVLSRRIVNWIAWHLGRGALSPAALHSLAGQVRALAARLEYHLLGNHLFENARALVFAGAFFEGAEADGWLRRGLAILSQELDEQLLADGGHFELSPMYHATILEGLLDLVQLSRIFPETLAQPAVNQRWLLRAGAMERWLWLMSHRDGEISYFNDSAFGIAPAAANLRAYGKQLGLQEPDPPVEGVSHLAASGYVRLEAVPWLVLFDAAEIGPSYLPGHAHADSLSVEISLEGERLVTNGGTSTYEIGAARDAERATSAHATVEVDGENSSEVWASFRVGRRAHILHSESSTGATGIAATATHDGYRHLQGKPLHRRSLTVEPHGISIIDELQGTGRHRLVGRFPLHPAVQVNGRMGDTWQLRLPSGAGIGVAVTGASRLAVSTAKFATAFGTTVDRPVLEWHADVILPTEVVVRFARTTQT